MHIESGEPVTEPLLLDILIVVGLDRLILTVGGGVRTLAAREHDIEGLAERQGEAGHERVEAPSLPGGVHDQLQDPILGDGELDSVEAVPGAGAGESQTTAEEAMVSWGKVDFDLVGMQAVCEVVSLVEGRREKWKGYHFSAG